jgi:hypothetical protein
MSKKFKIAAIFAGLCIIFFCLSFIITAKFIIEPRYAYMSQEGVFDEIKGLKDAVSEKEQRIAALEEEVEMYRTALSDAGLEDPQEQE